MAAKIVVLVSGSGSNLEALISACQAGEVPGGVTLVVADRKCRGLEVAEERGIPVKLVEFAAFSARDEWNEAVRDAVSAASPDLVVLAGFMRVLSPAFVDTFEGALINIHPSLLPSFPGAHAVKDALAFGAKVTGSTVHMVDHEVDHGTILLQEAVEIEDGDTEETLHERIKAVEHRILPAACRTMIERGS